MLKLFFNLKRNSLFCLGVSKSLFNGKRWRSSSARTIPKPGEKDVDVSFEKNAILSSFPEIHDEVLNEHLIYFKSNQELRDRYSKLLYYTLYLDPVYLSRAIFFVHSYRLLETSSRLTDENLRKACVLGWCHKMIDASIIMDDDIADKTEIRYNKPAWFKVKNVGPDTAVLDAAFVETSATFLMLNHIASHPQYVNIHKEVLRSYSTTNIGQTLEIQNLQLDEFENNQNFKKSYIFTLPLIKSALYFANIDDKVAHSVTEDLCIQFTRYLKIEDDVKGVFGTMSFMEKQCTDISEGCATWLAIEAYKRGTEAQKTLLRKHYGKDNTESVKICYNLFKDLKLEEAFNDFKVQYYEKMYSRIQNDLPNILPPQLFINYLDYMMKGLFRV